MSCTFADIASNFTFDGSDFLYASTKRVSVDELRLLLARGSGYVVRGGQRRKPWFQAQCAHYGLPAQGTLATLRLQLDKFLAYPTAQVPVQLASLEKKRQDEYNSARAAVQHQRANSSTEGHSCEPVREKVSPEIPTVRDCSTNRRGSPASEPQPTELLVKRISHERTHITTSTAKKRTIPRAKLAAVSQFRKSAVELGALQKIKLMMGRPKPVSDTETESDEDFDSDPSIQGDAYASGTPWTNHGSHSRRILRSLVPFTHDVGVWPMGTPRNVPQDAPLGVPLAPRVKQVAPG